MTTKHINEKCSYNPIIFPGVQAQLLQYVQGKPKETTTDHDGIISTLQRKNNKLTVLTDCKGFAGS